MPLFPSSFPCGCGCPKLSVFLTSEQTKEETTKTTHTFKSPHCNSPQIDDMSSPPPSPSTFAGIWLRTLWKEAEPMEVREANDAFKREKETKDKEEQHINNDEGSKQAEEGMFIIEECLTDAKPNCVKNDGKDQHLTNDGKGFPSFGKKLSSYALWMQSPTIVHVEQGEGVTPQQPSLAYFADVRHVPRVASPYGDPRWFAGHLTTSACTEEEEQTANSIFKKEVEKYFVGKYTCNSCRPGSDHHDGEEKVKQAKVNVIIKLPHELSDEKAHDKCSSFSPSSFRSAMPCCRLTWHRSIDSLPASCPSGVDSAMCVLIPPMDSLFSSFSCNSSDGEDTAHSNALCAFTVTKQTDATAGNSTSGSTTIVVNITELDVSWGSLASLPTSSSSSLVSPRSLPLSPSSSFPSSLRRWKLIEAGDGYWEEWERIGHHHCCSKESDTSSIADSFMKANVNLKKKNTKENGEKNTEELLVLDSISLNFTERNHGLCELMAGGEDNFNTVQSPPLAITGKITIPSATSGGKAVAETNFINTSV